MNKNEHDSQQVDKDLEQFAKKLKKAFNSAGVEDIKVVNNSDLQITTNTDFSALMLVKLFAEAGMIDRSDESNLVFSDEPGKILSDDVLKKDADGRWVTKIKLEALDIERTKDIMGMDQENLSPINGTTPM